MEETSHEEWKETRNVAFALDANPEAVPVLKWAADFAQEFGARLTIIHTVPFVTPLTHGFFDSDMWKALATEACQKMEGIKFTPVLTTLKF